MGPESVAVIVSSWVLCDGVAIVVGAPIVKAIAAKAKTNRAPARFLPRSRVDSRESSRQSTRLR
jgi:hypothetical protein